MDAEILQVVKGRRRRRRAAEPLADRPANGRCRSAEPDGLCRRYGLFVTRRLCASCRSDLPVRRAETRQTLGMARLAAEIGMAACLRRSRPIGRRSIRCGERHRDVLIHLCGRFGGKITAGNCALCSFRNPA